MAELGREENSQEQQTTAKSAKNSQEQPGVAKNSQEHLKIFREYKGKYMIQQGHPFSFVSKSFHNSYTHGLNVKIPPANHISSVNSSLVHILKPCCKSGSSSPGSGSGSLFHITGTGNFCSRCIIWYEINLQQISLLYL